RTYLLAVARQSLGPALQAKGGASDLVQDTYLEAQRLFPRFGGASNAELRAWLRCLLLHKAAKLGRRYHSTRKRQLSREVPLGRGGRLSRPRARPGGWPGSPPATTPWPAGYPAQPGRRTRARPATPRRRRRTTSPCSACWISSAPPTPPATATTPAAGTSCA